MVFNRQPRIQTPRPRNTVKLPAVPAIPAKQDTSPWLSVGLPLAGIIIMVVGMLIFQKISGGNNWQMLLFTPIMLISSLSSVLITRSQKKKRTQEIDTKREQYRRELVKVNAFLAKIHKAEDHIRKTIDPGLEECLKRALDRDPRLGERRPEDADFLNMRLGLGKALVSYRIERPDTQPVEEFAREIQASDLIYRKYSKLDLAPILARFGQLGSAGISGRREEVLETARAILVQACTHHWFDEVKIAIAVSPSSINDWAWSYHLPHYHTGFRVNKLPVDADPRLPLPTLLTRLEEELQNREQSVIAQKLINKEDQNASSLIPLPRLLIVFDYLPLGYSHPAIQLLLEKGPSLGVIGIFLTDDKTKIPGECGILINRNKNHMRYDEIGARGYYRECIADAISPRQAEDFAKALSNVPWARSEQNFQPPETITFLEMFDVKRVEELPISVWWNEKSPYGYMRAPIGALSGSSQLIFDLNDKDGAHGPHGLLGGMTGSGKSEVLKAIILSLAVTHHPYDLNFALIDFKGGAAFNELSKLPHTVGVVTDIESNATFAERVIKSLTGEIDRRKILLEEARAAFGFGRSHIDEYRQLPVRRPLPRLVVVFDEFAEFKQRNPEESKKLISVARQGRSLGVHLILATQNISAAVDPEIMQNSNFRICLKVAEPQDSIQMVGIPDAINLTRGRGYFSSNTRFLYQSAYSGAPYEPENISASASKPVYKPLQLPFAHKPLISSTIETKERSSFSGKETQVSAVINHINTQAELMGLKKPPSVWPAPLADRLFLPDILEKVINGGWNGKEWLPVHEYDAQANALDKFVLPIFGLVDQPSRQRQIPIQIEDELGGNLMVFGSAGSGKSTLLRTIMTSLALTYSPSEVNAYILDYGGQSSLKVLESFPHVGAVITKFETERTERLIQLIRTEIQRRNRAMRELRVDNWSDYNTHCISGQQFPALFLIIDNFRDFKQSFEHDFINEVTRLISGAQSAGLFLVLASSLQSDIPTDLYANINQRITFIQADQSEYYRIVGMPSEAKLMEDASKGLRPGRGMSRATPPEEYQAALPSYGENDKEQTENLIDLAETMRREWQGALPKPVNTLPYLATLSPHLIGHGTYDYKSPIGLDFMDLQATGLSLVNDGPSFLIGGVTRQCGKTTLIRTWLLSLAKAFSSKQLQVDLIDFHTRTLAGLRHLPIVSSYIGNRVGLEELTEKLMSEINRRQSAIEQIYVNNPDEFDIHNILKQWHHIVVVIDDYDRFYQSLGGPSENLADIIQKCTDCGMSFIISGEITDLPNAYADRFIDRVKRNGCGILLGGTEGIDEYNNTRRPIGAVPMGLPPGRGYIISRGQASMIQSMAYWDDGEEQDDAIKRWLKSF